MRCRAFTPPGESIAADRFLHGAYKIVIDASALPASQTLAAWAKSRVELVSQQFGCEKPTRSSSRLGGVSAVELRYASCSGEYFDVIEAVHNGRGYDVFWLGTKDVKPALARDLSTFRFLP